MDSMREMKVAGGNGRSLWVANSNFYQKLAIRLACSDARQESESVRSRVGSLRHNRRELLLGRGMRVPQRKVEKCAFEM